MILSCFKRQIYYCHL